MGLPLPGLTPQQTNYASNRNAWMSRAENDGVQASRAVDGNYAACTQASTPDSYPWWAVDLGQVINVSKVIVINSSDDRKWSMAFESQAYSKYCGREKNGRHVL